MEETELKGYWYFLPGRKISNPLLQFCGSEFNSENKALLVMQWRAQNLCTSLSTLSIPDSVERLWEQHHFTQNSPITHQSCMRGCLTSLIPTKKAFLNFSKIYFFTFNLNKIQYYRPFWHAACLFMHANRTRRHAMCFSARTFPHAVLRQQYRSLAIAPSPTPARSQVSLYARNTSRLWLCTSAPFPYQHQYRCPEARLELWVHSSRLDNVLSAPLCLPHLIWLVYP